MDRNQESRHAALDADRRPAVGTPQPRAGRGPRASIDGRVMVDSRIAPAVGTVTARPQSGGYGLRALSRRKMATRTRTPCGHVKWDPPSAARRRQSCSTTKTVDSLITTGPHRGRARPLFARRRSPPSTWVDLGDHRSQPGGVVTAPAPAGRRNSRWARIRTHAPGRSPERVDRRPPK